MLKVMCENKESNLKVLENYIFAVKPVVIDIPFQWSLFPWPIFGTFS